MANDPPKPQRVELRVTENTYNEISARMMEAGKITPGAEIILTKDITINNPLDPRAMGIRKDALDIAARIYKGTSDEDFLKFVETIVEYIKRGPKQQQAGWGTQK